VCVVVLVLTIAVALALVGGSSSLSSSVSLSVSFSVSFSVCVSSGGNLGLGCFCGLYSAVRAPRAPKKRAGVDLMCAVRQIATIVLREVVKIAGLGIRNKGESKESGLEKKLD
jgi:hypothetical protein